MSFGYGLGNMQCLHDYAIVYSSHILWNMGILDEMDVMESGTNWDYCRRDLQDMSRFADTCRAMLYAMPCHT